MSRFLFARPASRDLLWRTALVVVVVSPLLAGFRGTLASWQWPLAILPAVDAGISGPTSGGALSQRRRETSLPVRQSPHAAPMKVPSDRPTVGGPAEAIESAPAIISSLFPATDAPASGRPLFDGLPSWFLFTGSLWLAGTLFQCVRLTRAAWNAHRLTAIARPVTDPSLIKLNAWAATRVGLVRPATIATSPRVNSPIVSGLFRPAIVVPPLLLNANARRQLRAALLHESGHVRREDVRFDLLLKLVMAVFWPHPLVHVMALELRRLREEICDNYVLAEESPVAYAETLLRLAVGNRLKHSAMIGLGMFARQNRLEDRVNALLAASRVIETRPSALIRRLVLGTAGVVLLGLVLVRFDRAAAAAPIAAQPVGLADRPSTSAATHPTTAGTHDAPMKAQRDQETPSESRKEGTRSEPAGLPTPKEIQAGYHENFARLMPLGIQLSVTEADGIGNIEYDRDQQRLYQALLNAKPGEIGIDGRPADEAKIIVEMTRYAPSQLQQLDDQLTPEHIALRLKPRSQSRFFWTDRDSFHLREPRDDRGKMFAGPVSPPAKLAKLYPNVRLASYSKANQPPLRVWLGDGQGGVGTVLTDFWAVCSFPAVGFVRRDWIAYGWHDLDLFMAENPSRCRVVGRAELNGRSVILVDGFVGEEDKAGNGATARLRTRAWIDPNQGFLPLRLECAYLDSSGKETFRESVVEVLAVRKVADGYYPTRSKRQEYVNREIVKAPGLPPGPLLGRSKMWEVSEVTPRHAIERAALALEFPPGTLYMTGSDKKWYHVGSPAPEPQPPQPIKPGQLAPSLELIGWTDGQSRNLADYRGKVVVLDFWRMADTGRVNMVAAIKDVRARYKGVVFLEIHAAGAEINKIRLFQREQKWDAFIAVDAGSDLAHGATWTKFGLRTECGGLIVISRDGRVDFNCDALDEVSGTDMLWRAAKALSLPWNAKTTDAQDRQIVEHWLSEAIDKALAKP